MTEIYFGVGGVDQFRVESTITVERIVATFKVRYIMADFMVPERKKVTQSNTSSDRFRLVQFSNTKILP